MSHDPRALDAAPDAERLRLFESVVVNAHDAVVITEAEPINAPGPRIVYVNQSFTRVTGYTPDEVLGRSPRILQGPRTARAALDRIRRALERWEPVTVELVNYRKDGSEFVVENSIMPVANADGWFTHWVSIQRDITDRHRAEAELRESEEFFREAFDAGPLGMAVLDLDDRILQSNRKLADLLGLSPEAVLGRGLSRFAHPDDADRDALDALRLLRGEVESYHVDKRLLRADGQQRWARITSARVRDGGGRLMHLLAMVEDITEQRADREALVRARDQAERAARARAAFLATISHELRTPLHAVLGFGRVLSRETHGPLNDAQRSYVGHIVESGEHMARLVDELLDLRRHEGATEALVTRPTEAGPMIARALRMAGPLIDERHHRVAVALDEGLPRVEVEADATVQVLVNLLSNAARYTPAGGDIVVRGALDAEAARVRLSVEDNGIGIAPEDREKIFDYLAQVQSPEAVALRKTQRGTGLGLAIARAITRRLGGSLSVAAAPVRGSVFTLSLPVAEDPREGL